MRVLAKDAPSHFSSLLGSLPEGVKLLKTSTAKVECVIAFVRCKADVQAVAPAALDAVVEDGLLRFAYPKKSGSIKTDISRDHGWEPVFDAGFDSVAQISMDQTWTGFRFRAKHLVKKSTK
jgi:hypothetical protein